ncbi:MAG: carbohydrate kinase [Fuerstiella sp.]|jgi:fructokinase|nr:carbohydrate kinase [Fuerstiella sp.]MCP4509255.1 carbohydrate kinase [Fuerstiella sp.]MDG2129550.1 PfkB family carbohydrate kinase [Fuerstiella sp.]
MKRHIIVGIGEILWDMFPDGPRFGGAPSNFSCSAAEIALGAAEVFMISAVGADDLGRQAVDALEQHGVDTTCVQIADQQTGQVRVELDPAGVASYRFAEDTAWDNLTWNHALQKLAHDCDVVCFGTLGQRSAGSRSTVQKFVRTTSENTLRILDVNLRSPCFDDDVILESLALANVLKLNDEELPRLASLCRVAGNDVEILHQFAVQHQLRCVALTRGADGAVIVYGDDVSDLPAMPTAIADTVGAGDAFTAAMTLDLLAGRNVAQVNQSAIAAASWVCSQSGATPAFPAKIFRN